MRKSVCAACGLVNLESFPAFPLCEACGERLPKRKRRPLFDWVQRPVKTLVWAFCVGAGVATLALLSVGIARETRLRDRGVLIVSPSIVPDARGERGASVLLLRVATADRLDREPIRNLRLRLNQADVRDFAIAVTSPIPSAVEKLGRGHYFVWNEFALRQTIKVKLKPRRTLRLEMVGDGFEQFALVLSPVPQKAASSVSPANRSH